MATTGKIIATGGISGVVVVATTIATGVTIHTATTATDYEDQLAMFVSNTGSTLATVTLFAGTTAFAKKDISAKTGQETFVWSGNGGVVIYLAISAVTSMAVTTDVNRVILGT